MKQVTLWYVSLVFIIPNVAFELSFKVFFLFFPIVNSLAFLFLKTNYSTQFAVNVTISWGVCVFAQSVVTCHKGEKEKTLKHYNF